MSFARKAKKQKIGPLFPTTAAERSLISRPQNLPRVNLRPFLYSAFGLIFGIFLYLRIRFGGIRATDFVFFILLAALSLRPFSLKRYAAITLIFVLFAGMGAGLMHLYTERYLSGMESGKYEITGTVSTFVVNEDEGYTSVVLTDLTLNGVSADGKMTATLPSESIRTGDCLHIKGTVSRVELTNDSYILSNLFVKNIRYSVSAEEFSVTGKRNALLQLNSRMYDSLHLHLDPDEADVAYALLTGNSGEMDDGLATAVRQGGIAHIFAVSGLHIGILFGAVSLALKRLGRFRYLPASAIAFVYSAFCGFTVSSLRAAVMCSALALTRTFGEKYDFLQSISFAATLVLLIRPAEWLSAGFRLSFGAVAGLALFSGTLNRLFRKIKFPRFLSSYLSANLSVQLFTFPVLYETFSYFSVWGTLINLFLIPVLPVLFLGLFLSVLLALVFPAAAAVFLAVPNGTLSPLLYLFSVADFSFVLTGFSLGAGSAVYITGSVLLSERVRLGKLARALLAAFLVLLFSACLILRNAVFHGCKIISAEGIVLVRTPSCAVLVVGDRASVPKCESFLAENYGGKLDAVIAVTDSPFNAGTIALHLNAGEVRFPEETDTGLQETDILLDKTFSYGDISFRYESDEILTVCTENCVTVIDFSNGSFPADLTITDQTSSHYFLTDGKIYLLG